MTQAEKTLYEKIFQMLDEKFGIKAELNEKGEVIQHGNEQ